MFFMQNNFFIFAMKVNISLKHLQEKSYQATSETETSSEHVLGEFY